MLNYILKNGLYLKNEGYTPIKKTNSSNGIKILNSRKLRSLNLVVYEIFKLPKINRLYKTTKNKLHIKLLLKLQKRSHNIHFKNT